MAYFVSEAMKEEANHNKWYQSSSDPRELLEARAETTDSDFSRTLVVTIEDIRFPVTVEVLYRVFDQLGVVEDIEIHHGKETIQALVRFQVLSCANSAKIYLDKRCIFDGCCFMNIQFLSEINLEELLDQNIAIMKIFQAVLDMRKEISVGFQKMRDILSKPKILMKYTAPTNLSEKLSGDESILLKEESDEIGVKEVEIDPEIQVFDDMPVSGPDMFDDMLVSGVEESEKVEINSNKFDEIPMKNIEQLKLINISSKLFVVMPAKDLTEVKELPGIEIGPKELDETIVREMEEQRIMEASIQMFDDLMVTRFEELKLIEFVLDVRINVLMKELEEKTVRKLHNSITNELENYYQDAEYSQVMANGKMFATQTMFILCYKSEEDGQITNENTNGFCRQFYLNNYRSAIDIFLIDPGGGGLWHTWFNCGLTIAGRVMVRQQKDSAESFSHRLVRIEELASVLDKTVKAELNEPAAEKGSIDSKSQKHPLLLLQLIPPQVGFGYQQQIVSGDARMMFLTLTKQVDVVITEVYTLAYKLILKYFELGSLRSRIF